MAAIMFVPSRLDRLIRLRAGHSLLFRRTQYALCRRTVPTLELHTFFRYSKPYCEPHFT